MNKRICTVSSDRISIDVGGIVFHTNRSTLTGSSSYFRLMFSDDTNWVEAKRDTLFLDRDSDVFTILLSVMRSGSGLKLLPRDDQSLCVRVLRDAEFFGMDSFLSEVKVAAQKHLYPKRAKKHSVEAFDKEHTCIEEAIAAGVLPDRIFCPSESPRVKQIIAASKDAEVRFRDDQSNGVTKRKIVCYALMEYVDGRQHIEPVIANRPEGLGCDPYWHEGEFNGMRKGLQLWSTWLADNKGPNVTGWMVSPQGKDEEYDDDGEKYDHIRVRPRRR